MGSEDSEDELHNLSSLANGCLNENKTLLPTSNHSHDQQTSNFTEIDHDDYPGSNESSEELPMLEGSEELLQVQIKGINSRNYGTSSDVDRGWSWTVLAISFTMFMFGNGAQFAFGVMYSSIRRYFETSKATTSWILLLQRGTGSVFGKLSMMTDVTSWVYMIHSFPLEMKEASIVWQCK